MDYSTFANVLAKAYSLILLHLHIVFSALLPIYTGAYASLSRPQSAGKPKKTSGNRKGEEAGCAVPMERLSATDAILLPIVGGATLSGLYFLIKRYGAALVNKILAWYFSFISFHFLTVSIKDALNVVANIALPKYFAQNGRLYKIDSQGNQVAFADGKTATPRWKAIRMGLKQKYLVKIHVSKIVDIKVQLTPVNVFASFVAIALIAYANAVGQPWWLVNLQGFAICYIAMQLMTPTTFTTGALILFGLFCYDIWAVFFTPMMVNVATNLDAPMKLLFPRSENAGAETPSKSYSMLGLGDIVLPGLNIGLALRFDLYMHYLKKQKLDRDNKVIKAPYVSVAGNFGDRFWTAGLPPSDKPAQLNVSFPKPYFTAAMVGYVMAMAAAFSVMAIYEHAQPALLYLVPGVLCAIWGTALVRGELKQMWAYSEMIKKDPTAAKTQKPMFGFSITRGT
ncbi:peptidase A22B, signal peptide peptidase [Piedraia hortae CBS 480.64]|uniref:Peptidase A22B, signal peptide peptidase n=1 Tax=Piedraia hortae CBS 480.64 TaxID=1314780 RepID=A0A6A7BR80_9PEZI|nr:peptidase A22B, signal peptide peptidase [Piedraia hortae CBS 480.64]